MVVFKARILPLFFNFNATCDWSTTTAAATAHTVYGGAERGAFDRLGSSIVSFPASDWMLLFTRWEAKAALYRCVYRFKATGFDYLLRTIPSPELWVLKLDFQSGTCVLRVQIPCLNSSWVSSSGPCLAASGLCLFAAIGFGSRVLVTQSDWKGLWSPSPFSTIEFICSRRQGVTLQPMLSFSLGETKKLFLLRGWKNLPLTA